MWKPQQQLLSWQQPNLTDSCLSTVWYRLAGETAHPREANVKALSPLSLHSSVAVCLMLQLTCTDSCNWSIVCASPVDTKRSRP